MESSNIDMAKHLMDEFAIRTGLDPVQDTTQRYLWTDAFAVCNFLGLCQVTNEEHYQSMALDLIDQVHHVLGRHRTDDHRDGWISGLTQEEGERHPTRGGLRIGKELNERKPGEPHDEKLEWEQDGQYFHYLTKWMHALHRAHLATGQSRYDEWAVELAKTAHRHFTWVSAATGEKSMHWKMSIDLSRPLVPSMGHHDPLDGFITFQVLRAAYPKTSDASAFLRLDDEIADMAAICEGRNWTTDDALGLGGLLCDAFRLAQLHVHGDLEMEDLLETLVKDALFGLGYFARNSQLDAPAAYRLAFRELGLTIGFHALERLQDLIDHNLNRFRKKYALQAGIEKLDQYTPLREVIESFWLDPRSREADTWKAHEDINAVMLATSLTPDGFLSIV